MRAQANLLALGAAIVLLTGATATGLFVAGGAMGAATDEPTDRSLASGLADRLVASKSPLTVDRGTLLARNVSRVTDSWLASRLPDGVSASVALDGDLLASRGDVTTGSRVVRLVRMVTLREMIRLPEVVANDTADSDILVQTDRWIDVSINASAGQLQTVWVDDRLVLENPNGLAGEFRIHVGYRETVELTFGATEAVEEQVELVVYRREVTFHRLVVVVDA